MGELRLSNRKSPIPAEVGRTRDVTFFPAFTVDSFTLQALILYIHSSRPWTVFQPCRASSLGKSIGKG
jgi:hypothetical protein